MLKLTLKYTQPDDEGEASDFASETTDPSEALWVVFESEPGNTWTAKLKRGIVKIKSRASGLSDGSVFVLAGGQGYFLEPTRRALLSKTGVDSYRSFIAIPSSALVAATDGCQVDLLNQDGTVWSSPRIATDEIQLILATENEVKGRANVIPPTMFREFTLHVKERKIEFLKPSVSDVEPLDAGQRCATLALDCRK